MVSKSSLRILWVVCIWGLTISLEGTSLNISGVVRDSLTHDSLPMVSVTIEEYGQTFSTTRSGFYVALGPGSYTFVLDADRYETLRQDITVVSEGQEFLFEMVKQSDRAELDKKSDSLLLFIRGFQYAIDNRRIDDAYRYMLACKRFNAPDEQLDSMKTVYLNTKTLWIDSVFLYAQILEDSQKLSDAYYYYKKIIAVDSLHEGAQERLAETETALTASLEGKTQSGSDQNQQAAPRLTPEQIESMFNQAVAKFLEEDYNGALSLLQAVLKNDPNHEGAKNYLSRTQARLQVQ